MQNEGGCDHNRAMLIAEAKSCMEQLQKLHDIHFRHIILISRAGDFVTLSCHKLLHNSQDIRRADCDAELTALCQ